MTSEQVRSILRHGAFPGPAQAATLIETHISWVILTPAFAFKIKKPVVLDFLDFSTLDKREYYCREELRLNARLAPDMYLGLAGIRQESGQFSISENTEGAVDFAVRMRRLDSRLQMDILLAENRVFPAQIGQLASVLADFHKKVRLSGPVHYHPDAYLTDFSELFHFQKALERHIGSEATPLLDAWKKRVPEFLHRHAYRLQERILEGFWVDGHGDLHTRNIFLTDPQPTVFDCIEFNPHFRQIDILNELAFLVMDLEAQNHPELGDLFLNRYTALWDIFPLPEDKQLFHFFKAYRANVRLKVALIGLRGREDAGLKTQVRRYWAVLEGSCRQIREAD